MTGFLATVTVLLPFADPDLSYPLPDGADMRIARPSRTHGPGCRAAVFSRDGTKLATVSDRTVLVREWPGGRRLIEIHFPRITSDAGVAFSPDGRQVAAWETGFSSVQLGDLRTGDDWRLESQRSSHDHFSISHVAFVSNGVLRVFGQQLDDRLAPTYKFEAVDFDPARQTPVARRELPGQPLALAADGSAAILKVDGELRRFDLTVQRLVGNGVKAPTKIEGIAVDATAGRYAVRDSDGKISVFAPTTGERLMQVQLPAELNSTDGGSPFIPVELVLSPDGSELATAQDVTNPMLIATLTQVKDNKKLTPLADSSWRGRAASICYGPTAGSVTVIGDDGHVRTFDRGTSKRSDSRNEPLGFAVSRNGKWLANYDGNTLIVRDAVSGRVARREKSERRGQQFALLTDDGAEFYADPRRNRAFLPGTDRWADLEEEQLRVSQSLDCGAITSVVAAARVPPKAEGEWGEAFQLAAAREGRTLAVARNTHVDLFDADLRHLRRIQVIPLRDEVQRLLWSDIQENVTGVAVSADGRWVAIGKHTTVQRSALGTEFFIHEVATGARVGRIDYIRDEFRPLGFTPNGRHLWVSSGGTALRYELTPPPMPVFDRRNLLAELRGENAALAHLAAGRLASPGMLTWLGEQLPPDQPPDPKRVAGLIRQLADREFNVREAATAALIELGPGVVPALKDVQKTSTSPEAKRRAAAVLNRVSAETGPDVLLRTRAVVAVAMLAEDGPPDARKLLAKWSKGLPASPLTADARAALARLPN